MHNSKVWKHFKTLDIEMFQNKVEFKCWVCSLLVVIIKSRINVYVEMFKVAENVRSVS